MRKISKAFICLIIWLTSVAPAASAAQNSSPLAKIDHIVVLYLENHSFDNLFGTFPGADGLANTQHPQTNPSGTPYQKLPAITGKEGADARFSEELPNQPFLISHYVPYDQKIPDPIHRFYQTQQQINNGRMDKFVASTNVGGLVMGYYEEKDSPLWQYAQRYTLADHFFTAGFGGSLFNHFWLVCACAPHYPHAPDVLKTTLDKNGSPVRDGELTPDGYAVNNIQPFSAPYDASKALKSFQRLPAITLPTIGDRLSAKGIRWAWYNGGWNDAVAGRKSSFIPHHNPFLYFKNFAKGSAERKAHLKDEADLLEAIKSNTLPQVVFYKPEGRYDLHPGYSSLREGEEHVFDIVRRIEQSPAWDSTLIIVTFDDAGGFYDHVAPPKRDRFGPGIRIPALFISPHVKKGGIDHTNYDTTSILKLIEQKFALKPLNNSYRNAGSISAILQ